MLLLARARQVNIDYFDPNKSGQTIASVAIDVSLLPATFAVIVDVCHCIFN